MVSMGGQTSIVAAVVEIAITVASVGLCSSVDLNENVLPGKRQPGLRPDGQS